MPDFDDVRSIAMALPDVEERLTWETDVTFRVRDKIFAIGSEGSDGISVKASLDRQADLMDFDPKAFGKAPYVGRFGWVTVRLARVDRPLLEQLLRDAWRATAPKKLRDRMPE
jgi:hypothetical protein